MRISWDKAALNEFIKAVEFIAEKSPSAASVFANEIEHAIRFTALHPFSHPPDKYRSDLHPAFRAFELHHFRISYRIESDVLIVIRFRHSKMRPVVY